MEPVFLSPLIFIGSGWNFGWCGFLKLRDKMKKDRAMRWAEVKV
jgi:hypothetical protein